MKKLECLSTFKKSELSFEMKQNIKGGLSSATDGGVRPIPELEGYSEGGWMLFTGDEITYTEGGSTHIYHGQVDQDSPFAHLGF
jgi:hypothetical protein